MINFLSNGISQSLIPIKLHAVGGSVGGVAKLNAQLDAGALAHKLNEVAGLRIFTDERVDELLGHKQLELARGQPLKVNHLIENLRRLDIPEHVKEQLQNTAACKLNNVLVEIIYDKSGLPVRIVNSLDAGALKVKLGNGRIDPCVNVS